MGMPNTFFTSSGSLSQSAEIGLISQQLPHATSLRTFKSSWWMLFWFFVYISSQPDPASTRDSGMGALRLSTVEMEGFVRDSQWTLWWVVNVCCPECCSFASIGGHGRRLGARAFGSRRARASAVKRGIFSANSMTMSS